MRDGWGGWMDGWMGELMDDGWMDGWMDGRSDAKVISATEAAVTKPVGAGAAGSICVPSRILPGAPRSRPHSAVAQRPWQLHQGRSRPYFWRLGRGGPLRLVWGVLREPPPSADPKPLPNPWIYVERLQETLPEESSPLGSQNLVTILPAGSWRGEPGDAQPLIVKALSPASRLPPQPQVRLS